MLHVPRQFRTVELCFMSYNAVQDSRTLLHVSIQSGPVKLATWSSAVRASELCYKFQPHMVQCSSGSSNDAVSSNAGQDSRTLLFGKAVHISNLSSASKHPVYLIMSACAKRTCAKCRESVCLEENSLTYRIVLSV